MEIQFNARLQKELTIHDIQVAMEAGQLTSKELVMYYLHRIAKYDQEGPKNQFYFRNQSRRYFLLQKR